MKVKMDVEVVKGDYVVHYSIEHKGEVLEEDYVVVNKEGGGNLLERVGKVCAYITKVKLQEAIEGFFKGRK